MHSLMWEDRSWRYFKEFEPVCLAVGCISFELWRSAEAYLFLHQFTWWLITASLLLGIKPTRLGSPAVPAAPLLLMTSSAFKTLPLKEAANLRWYCSSGRLWSTLLILTIINDPCTHTVVSRAFFLSFPFLHCSYSSVFFPSGFMSEWELEAGKMTQIHAAMGTEANARRARMHRQDLSACPPTVPAVSLTDRRSDRKAESHLPLNLTAWPCSSICSFCHSRCSVSSSPFIFRRRGILAGFRPAAQPWGGCPRALWVPLTYNEDYERYIIEI